MSCQKEIVDDRELYESEIVIAGYDLYSHYCQEGYVINIQNDTKYLDALFTDTFPSTEISSTMLFPRKAFINWQPDTISGCANRIIITRVLLVK